MPDIDPENLSGDSPRFMTQGWHGHIAININDTDSRPVNTDNCKVPEFDAEVRKGY